jgi:hypothetical protein
MNWGLATEQISSSNLLSAVSAILSRASRLPVSSAMLYRGHLPHRCLSPFNLYRARVRRNHGRLPSNGLIERAQSSTPSSTASPKRASD